MTRRLETLFDRYRARGDVQALARVFDRTAAELLRVAMHLVRDPVAAEDLLQETFLTAIEHAERYDRARPLVPWLVGILTNHARRHRRREARRPDPTRLPARGTHAPDGELEARVAERIDALPDRYRQIVFLRLRFGMQPAAIAHLLGMPPATVRTRLHRGIERVRARLPAGLALALLPPPSPLRGVDAVREAVVGHASTTAVTAGATTTVGLVTLGSLAVTKTQSLVLLALLVGALAGGYAILGPSDLDDRSQGETATTPREAEGPALVARGTPAVADGDGDLADTEDAEGDDHAGGPLRVAGTVVDEEGKPVPGAAIDLWTRRGAVIDHLPSARADDTGRYRVALGALLGLAPLQLATGTLYVRARAPGFRPGEPTEFELVAHAEGGLLEGDALLERGVGIAGRVVDRSGRPVPRIAVTVRTDPANGQAWMMRTDDTGRYALPGEAPGTYVASVENSRGTARSAPRIVKAGETVTMPDLVLDEHPSVQGVVQAADGTPLPGVVVQAAVFDAAQAERLAAGDEVSVRGVPIRAGEGGTFVAHAPVGGRVHLLLDGDDPDASAVVASPGDRGVVVRARAPAIVARVVDAQGRPLPGASIGLRGWRGAHRDVPEQLAAGTLSRAEATALADMSEGGRVQGADGTYTTFVQPGARWIVSARVVGAWPAETVVSVDEGLAVRRVDLVIHEAQPDGHLDLTVLEPDGTRLTNFAVSLRTPLGTGLGTPSCDEEGVLPPLHSGDLCIRVLPNARRNHMAEMYGVGTWLLPARARVTVPPAGRVPLTIRLEEGGRFRLRLVYPEGEEPKRDSLRVRLFPAGESVRFTYAAYWIHPRDDGQTSVSSRFLPGEPRLNARLLAPGTYRVEFRTQHHGTHERTVTIRAGVVTDLEIELPARER